MPQYKFVNAGQCRCAQVQFEVTTEPLITMACHCTGCQRMTASAFSLSSLYPDRAFSVTLGEPVIGGLHGATRHYFCEHCKSWLFTRPEGMDEYVNVRAVLLESAATYSPFVECYVTEKLPWATTGAVHSYERFPEPEDLPALLAEFAQRSG